MCNLYSLTSTQSAIADLVQLWNDQTGNLPPLTGIYPDYPAPVVTQESEGRVMRMMRWGMPSPAFVLEGKKTDKGVTNVRNTSSPHWRRWLGPEHRCIVPFTSFSEYQVVKGQPPKTVWFAPTGPQKTLFFAGIWTNWTSVRKLKEGETTNDLFAFLTVEPNGLIATIHPKAMPVILRSEEAIAHWLTAPAQEALKLQRPFPDDGLEIVGEAV
jgi:putative SOS response-associated peptidase YedK